MLNEGTASPSQIVEDSSSRMVTANDLLIVGPGVLGRLVAEKWKEVKFFNPQNMLMLLGFSLYMTIFAFLTFYIFVLFKSCFSFDILVVFSFFTYCLFDIFDLICLYCCLWVSSFN